MNLLVPTILICQVLLIIAGIYFIWSWLNQTPFYPSSTKLLKKFLESKAAEIPKTITFVDIGSGDGRIVSLASRYAKEADGIEYNPFLTLISKLRLFRKNNTKIINGDFFKQDYSKYNVAYLYIFNEQIEKLREKLFAEMPKGSIIITNTFNFKTIKPKKTFEKLYIYQT